MAKPVKRKCPKCGEVKLFRTDQLSCGCKNPEVKSVSTVEVELEKLRVKRANHGHTVSQLTERVFQLEREKEALLRLTSPTPQSISIPPKTVSKDSESVAVIVWSDHHIEEEILPDAVGGLNVHNLDIADRRFQRLLHGGLVWYNIEKQKTTIKTIVLALLGDFINGSIHEDCAESNLLSPVEAIYKAQGHLIGGIQYMLDNTPPDVEFVLPCHSGNHGRMTQKQRIATESGNSLEHYMYLTIRDFFQNEKRLKFIVATGYHSYVSLFDGQYDIRFHHGHMINYGGGVGGLTIPVNKAIAQWNKSRRVNLDVFGHFHTRMDGGNFIANGSVVGYNAYALSIKASFEKPSQTFFLVNKEYAEKTMVGPIFLE